MSDPNFKSGTIWTGDNLDIMRGMNSNCVDLIYLDPPFNSNADYAAPIGSEAAGAEFKDTWTLSDVDVEWINLVETKHPELHQVLLAAMTNSNKSYLVYMAPRILEMRRILKPAGSIYLHCDPTMSHYLKLVMDAVFVRHGGEMLNEIVWERIKGAGKRSQHKPRSFGRSSDHIFFYSREGGNRFHADAVAVPYDDLHQSFPHEDDKGRYKRRSPFRPPGLGPRPNLCYEYKGVMPPHSSGWTVKESKLEELDREGEIEWAGGTPWRKQRPGSGIIPNNIWTDINPPSRGEDTGYPTQKPLALLERIILASSSQGDFVMDPFCGCATTLVAADRLDRQWTGIDISEKAAELVVSRIERSQGLWKNITHRLDIPKRDDIGILPTYNSAGNRNQLYGLQGGYCADCGTHFEPRHLEIDLIVARSKGGTDHLENLQLLCVSCNRIKGDRGLEYLQSKLKLVKPRSA